MTAARHIWPAYVVVLAAIVTIRVAQLGWVSDDALITFRYVSNTLDGHGPVFNLGERVQGYTHPAWFILLTAVSAVYEHPLWVTVGLGTVLTAATVAGAGFGIGRSLTSTAQRFLAMSLVAYLMLSSRGFLEFQTGGLENPLANFIIVAIVVVAVLPDRLPPFTTSALAGLLVLTRPDLALIVAPLAIAALIENHSRRDLAMYVLGAIPVAAWYAFSLAYYGDVVPNTAHAKVGIYATWWDSFRQGSRYLLDWIEHEPAASVGSMGLLAVGLGLGRGLRERAWALGIALYGLYVVVIGGDFMSARFWLPAFVGASVFGGIVLARLVPVTSPIPVALAAAPAMAAGVLITVFVATEHSTLVANSTGIVSERAYHEGLTLSHYVKTKKLEVPFEGIDTLLISREYAAKCGPVTISYGAIGYLGYYTGPDVDVIDQLGLTDRYIATLSKDLILYAPRPGHAVKDVPLSYYVGRGDITQQPRWPERLVSGDCSLREDALTAAAAP